MSDIPPDLLALAQQSQAQARQSARDLQEQQEASQRATAQAAQDEARRAETANKQLWASVQWDSDIKELLKIIEKTTIKKVKQLLTAAVRSLDHKLLGVPDGNRVKPVRVVRNWLHDCNENLPTTGPFGKKRTKRLKDLLREQLAIVPETEFYDVDDEDDGSLSVVPVPSGQDEDDDSDLDDDATLPPLPDRPQKEPSEFVDQPPQKVQEAFDIIMGIDDLRSKIRFELAPFLLRVHDNIVNGMSKEGTFREPHKLMMGGGKCQSRKTPLKVCMFIMGRLLGVSTLLLTTGTSGRDDLFDKFTKMLRGSDLKSPHQYVQPPHEFLYGLKKPTDTLPSLLNVRSAAGQERERPLILRHGTIGGQTFKTDWAIEQLLQGVCLVVNNSCQAMTAARTLLETAKARAVQRGRDFHFLLIIDEADDFYRTEEGTSENDDGAIQMEKAMNRLQELGPLIKFDVSATLFAIYLTLVKMGRADDVPYDDIFYVEASDEYVGTDLLLPPEDSNGNPIFLSANELHKKNKYINPKVEALWEDAVKNPRALVLDATTSAVRAPGNIYEKADEVLKMYPNAITIVVSGGMIEWRTLRPVDSNPEDGRPWGTRTYKGKEKMFGPILEVIDRRYRQRPIFVFGYSQLMRGLSYRSSRRVPSHYALLYGKSMSICRLVQAAGRAQGDQERILRENGFEAVRILTQAHDFDTIKNYPSFLEAIKERMAGGMSLEAALQQKWSGKFNFSGRINGAKKTNLQESNPNPHPHPNPNPNPNPNANPNPNQEIKQQLLDFHPTQAGELPGAEAAVAEILHFSDKRVVVEVLRAGKGHDNIDDDAMNTTEILKEIQATSEYEAFLGDDVKPDTTAEIGHILGTLQEPLKSLNLPPLVERIEGRRPMFCLNNNVLDRLDGQFKMPEAHGTLLLAPPSLSREPSAATPGSSVAHAIPIDDVESQDLYEVLHGEEAQVFRSLMLAGED